MWNSLQKLCKFYSYDVTFRLAYILRAFSVDLYFRWFIYPHARLHDFIDKSEIFDLYAKYHQRYNGAFDVLKFEMKSRIDPDLLNNRPSFVIYLRIATPINKSSKLALGFLLRIINLLHSDWSKMRYFNLLYNCPFS